MASIQQVTAREVLDSRGRPTVQAEVVAGDRMGAAIAPAGASTGRSEAVELRDGDARYDGLGVRRAVEHVNSQLAPLLLGCDVHEQHQIDQRMIRCDGDAQKGRLGANAILAVSLAAAHASAAVRRIPLWRHIHQLMCERHPQAAAAPAMPRPMVNMISGGLHAGGNLDIQDVLLLAPSGLPYHQQLERIVRCYWRLGEQLAAAGHQGRLVGDEGGYGPQLSGNRQALQLVLEAADQTDDLNNPTLALDIAATHFFRDGRYEFASESRGLSADAWIDELAGWADAYPIESIEDGLGEDDWDGWRRLTERLGDRVRLVGDDLFTTNCDRIRKGVRLRAGNAVLIKPNQIGTLSETLEAIALCRDHDLHFIVSARSGETEDVTIADLAVGVGAPEIKIGSVARGERLAKYNRLLRIEEQLDSLHG